MRLINTKTLRLEEVFDSSRRPPYAILSHTWGRDEVNFQEWEQLQEGDADTRARIQAKRGFKKIEDACRIARGDEPESKTQSDPESNAESNTERCAESSDDRNTEEAVTGYDYLWVDTNCIDKKSSAELSEAINSMFHWYETASCCIVYLEDVSIRLVGPGMDHLPNSRWFSRGWTLQELLAPPWAENVLFYNDKWERIGSRPSLCKDLSTLTGISEFILLDSPRYRDCSVAQRMSWASRRETTRVEDTAYCLLGLFDINMPLLYGEKDRAFRRLQEEIMKVSTDQTLFAWDCNRMLYDMDGHHAISILAPDPSYFRECSCVVQASNIGNNSEITLTNVGLTMTLPLVRTHDDQVVYTALGCRHENDFKTRFCVPLTTLADDSDNAHSNTVFTRNPYYLPSLLSIKTTRIPEQPVKICIPRMSHGKRLRWESWRIADIPNSRVLLQLFPANDALSDWEVKSWFELTTLWNVPFPKSRSVAKGCYLEFRHPKSKSKPEEDPWWMLAIMWSNNYTQTHVSFRKMSHSSRCDGPFLMGVAALFANEASCNKAACDGLAIEVDFSQRRVIDVDLRLRGGGFMLPVFVDKIPGGPKAPEANEFEDRIPAGPKPPMQPNRKTAARRNAPGRESRDGEKCPGQNAKSEWAEG